MSPINEKLRTSALDFGTRFILLIHSHSSHTYIITSVHFYEFARKTQTTCHNNLRTISALSSSRKDIKTSYFQNVLNADKLF